jgi:hypothetical protein
MESSVLSLTCVLLGCLTPLAQADVIAEWTSNGFIHRFRPGGAQ